jgi:hypothetical protein
MTKYTMGGAVVCAAFLAAASPVTAAPCGDPKTQGGYFLDVVRDIALNSDLTDLKPLQTILESKLDAHPVIEGEEAGHRVDYSGHALFGHPAEVTYSAIDEPRLQKKAGWVATLTVRFDPAWLALAPKTVEACLTPTSSGRLRVTWNASGGAGRIGEITITLAP